MIAKVHWYEDVLAADPSSKVFLPYARELLKSGDADKAVTVLRRGLGFYPEHFEAGVLLVHVLYENGMRNEARTEAGRIIGMISEYPGFIGAWADVSPSADCSVYLRLIEGVIRGRNCSLADIVQRGIVSAIGAESTIPAAPTISGKGPQTDFVISGEALPEEPITLRTRSMAALLAEQGDIPGALDIYGEILANHPEDTAIATEIERLTELRNGPVGMPFQPVAKTSEEVSVVDGGPSRLRTLLSRLADRLEARAE